MNQRKLGANGPQVAAVGLGCMGMSISYGTPDDVESVATMHRALDLGCNLLVTSDAYGNGVNEELVGKAIKGRRKQALVCTKFGNLMGGGGVNGRPEYAMEACAKSLQRLGVDEIDIYGLHRVDPNVPIEETVGAMKRLQEQGKVRYLVLSEAGPETLKRAMKVATIDAVETEYSLWSRDAEAGLIAACKELGVGYMAYAPLGRGFLSATIKSLDALIEKDRRRQHPRYLPENIGKNVGLLAPLEQIAAAHKAKPAQIALAWVLAQGEFIVPIPGTKRRTYLEENLAAVEVVLSADEIATLSDTFKPGVTAGTRYPEAQLKGVLV
ncbi:MAG: aldo/keto reductase [Proteobacteria bacterium]|nr:aldo/keto reductase [Burkholderiales bacterium]